MVRLGHFTAYGGSMADSSWSWSAETAARDWNGSRVKAATVTASGDKSIDGLLSGFKWGGAITYSFPDSAGDYQNGYFDGNARFKPHGSEGFKGGLTSKQKSAFHFALDAKGSAAGFSVEGFTDLDISFIDGGSGAGTIRGANWNDSSSSRAFAFLPGSSHVAGDAFFNNNLSTLKNPVAGDIGWRVMLHEIGHSLGLKHGHEAYANRVLKKTFHALPAEVDSPEFTVMTYRNFINDSDKSHYRVYDKWSMPQTFMMLDIAALQHMYGADFTTNSGNTTYKWRPGSGDTWINGRKAIDAGGKKIFATIWDGGGTDTYDLTLYATEMRINLEPGEASTFSWKQLAVLGGGRYFLAQGNIFNALQYKDRVDSLIENVRGGRGNDTIIGNQAKNTLWGNNGNDTLYGGEGDDKLYGGKGVDVLYGGPGNDYLYVDAKGSALYGGADNDWLYGGAGHDGLDGGGGNDRLYGGAGNDRLVGGAGDDWLYGGGGHNWSSQTDDYGAGLYGGAGDDRLYGGDRRDRLEGGAGNDLLYGGSGGDKLYGGNGNDRLYGGKGSDELEGGAGNDLLYAGRDGGRLFGGAGNDLLYAGSKGDLHGGAGSDKLYAGNGNNWLYGGAGRDVLYGGAGDDQIDGDDGLYGGGNDLLYGGIGNDTLYGGNGNDVLYGGAGNDRLEGGPGDDVIYGGAGVDKLFGREGNDHIYFDQEDLQNSWWLYAEYSGGPGYDVAYLPSSWRGLHFDKINTEDWGLVVFYVGPSGFGGRSFDLHEFESVAFI